MYALSAAESKLADSAIVVPTGAANSDKLAAPNQFESLAAELKMESSAARSAAEAEAEETEAEPTQAEAQAQDLESQAEAEVEADAGPDVETDTDCESFARSSPAESRLIDSATIVDKVAAPNQLERLAELNCLQLNLSLSASAFSSESRSAVEAEAEAVEAEAEAEDTDEDTEAQAEARAEAEADTEAQAAAGADMGLAAQHKPEDIERKYDTGPSESESQRAKAMRHLHLLRQQRNRGSAKEDAEEAVKKVDDETHQQDREVKQPTATEICQRVFLKTHEKKCAGLRKIDIDTSRVGAEGYRSRRKGEAWSKATKSLLREKNRGNCSHIGLLTRQQLNPDHDQDGRLAKFITREEWVALKALLHRCKGTTTVAFYDTRMWLPKA